MLKARNNAAIATSIDVTFLLSSFYYFGNYLKDKPDIDCTDANELAIVDGKRKAEPLKKLANQSISTPGLDGTLYLLDLSDRHTQ